MFSYLGSMSIPAMLIFFGALLVAIGSLWAAYDQNKFDRDLQKQNQLISSQNSVITSKNVEITALLEKVSDSLTGGDSYLSFTLSYNIKNKKY